jgi:hypothetical protein
MVGSAHTDKYRDMAFPLWSLFWSMCGQGHAKEGKAMSINSSRYRSSTIPPTSDAPPKPPRRLSPLPDVPKLSPLRPVVNYYLCWSVGVAGRAIGGASAHRFDPSRCMIFSKCRAFCVSGRRLHPPPQTQLLPSLRPVVAYYR